MEQNQPGIVKDNAATRMAEFVRNLNSERGTPMARQSGEAPMVVAKVVPASMAAPLSEEEIATRDAAAAAIGIIPKTDEDFPKEEASMTAREFLGRPDRVSVREIMEAHPVSRLLDFKKVQGIDLIRGVAWIDSFEITIPEPDVAKFKRYVLELATDFVTRQLAEALAGLTPPVEEPNGTDTQTSGETMPEVQDIPPDK